MCVLIRSGTGQIVWCKILPVNGIGNQTLSFLLALWVSLLLSHLQPARPARSFKLYPSRLDSVAVEPPHSELSVHLYSLIRKLSRTCELSVFTQKSVYRQSIHPRFTSCFQMEFNFQFRASFKYWRFCKKKKENYCYRSMF